MPENNPRLETPGLRAQLSYDSALALPEQDRLGRTSFARELARSIMRMDASEPFVFALHGPWGSGKSTVLNFVRYFLEHPDLLGDTYPDLPPIHIVTFNPWWFSGSDELLRDFFRQFRLQVGAGDAKKKGKLKDLGTKLELFSKVLSPVESLVTFVDPTGLVKSVVSKTREVTKSAAELANAAVEASTVDVYDLKKGIEETLRGQESRILVIMDDLDRLNSKELVQMFQIVKAIADFPRTIYLLSFDRIAVSEALRSENVTKPDEYLEKIVQSAFDLPEPDPQGLRELTGELINGLIGETPKQLWNQSRWIECYFGALEALITTPRDLKRLTNAIRPSYPPVKGEVDLVDFIAIQSVRVFAPSLFNYIVGNRSYLTNSGSFQLVFNADEYRESQRSTQLALLNTLPERKRRAVDTIMRVVFSKWNPTGTDRFFGDGSPSNSLVARRAHNPDVFDYYFRLGIPDRALSSAEVLAILESCARLEEFRETLTRFRTESSPDGISKLNKFLDNALEFVKAAHSIGWVGELINAIFVIGDELCNKLDFRGITHMPTIHQLRDLANEALLRFPDLEVRKEQITNAFKNGKSLSLMIATVQEWTEKSRKPSPARMPVGKDDIPTLQQILAAKLPDAAADGSLRTTPYLDFALIFWEQNGEREAARAYAKSLETEDPGLADLILGFCGPGYLSNNGILPIDTKSLSQWVTLDLEVIAEKCRQWKSFPPPWMTDLRRVAIESFLANSNEDHAF